MATDHSKKDDEKEEVEDPHSDPEKKHHEQESKKQLEEADSMDEEMESRQASNIANENIAGNIKTEDTSDTVFVKKSSSTSRLFILALFFGLVIGLIIFGGYLLYDSSYNPIKAEPTPTPAPAEPSPTPEEEVDLTVYKVQVLNGTGETGAAGEVVDLLEGAGFENFETGNADNYDFENTEVAMKPSVNEKAFDAIVESLEEEGYKVVEVTNLSDDDDFDIIVTTGTVSTNDQDDSDSSESSDSSSSSEDSDTSN